MFFFGSFSGMVLPGWKRQHSASATTRSQDLGASEIFLHQLARRPVTCHMSQGTPARAPLCKFSLSFQLHTSFVPRKFCLSFLLTTAVLIILEELFSCYCYLVVLGIPSVGMIAYAHMLCQSGAIPPFRLILISKIDGSGQPIHDAHGTATG